MRKPSKKGKSFAVMRVVGLNGQGSLLVHNNGRRFASSFKVLIETRTRCIHRRRCEIGPLGRAEG
jgi:hypothetical protein